MASEDDDDAFGGPPPDPSTRPWRHPSEIASASAAAARPPGTRRRWWSPWSFAVGGAAGAALCLGALVVVTSSLTGGGSNRVEFRSSAPPISAALGRTPPSTTSSTSLAVTSTVDPDRSGSISTAALREVPPTVDDRGVVAVYGPAGSDLLANAIVVDGMVLTSASAVADRERIRLRHDEGWIDAKVVGRDRFTDVAVIEPVDSTVVLAESVELGPEVAINTGDVVVLVAIDGQPQPIRIIGEVMALDERASTTDGHTVIGALLTNVRFPKAASGAALVDEAGHTVGMIVDSDSHLAAAIPLSTALDVGRALVERGWPSQAWLGVHGTDVDGGIRVTEVIPDGPAHDAGLLAEDLLISLNGQQVPDMADLVRELRRLQPGESVAVEVRRDGQTWSVTLEPKTKAKTEQSSKTT